MAKLTATQVEATKIIRAMFSNGTWTILVTDADNKIYNVRFAGLEADADALILSNTHAALLLVDAYVAPVLPVNVEKKDIYGLAPKA
jgi:hypothetical protein